MNFIGDAPLLGWGLFIAVCVAWAIDRLLRWRQSHASTTKLKLEAKQVQLGLLRDAADSYRGQLDTIAEVLRSDIEQPTMETIDEFAERQGMGSATQSLAAHLRARQRARAELPGALTRLSKIQEQQHLLHRDFELGVRGQDVAIVKIEEELRGIAKDVRELIREIGESPRIFVSPTEPLASNDGDLWLW